MKSRYTSERDRRGLAPLDVLAMLATHKPGDLFRFRNEKTKRWIYLRVIDKQEYEHA